MIYVEHSKSAMLDYFIMIHDAGYDIVFIFS